MTYCGVTARPLLTSLTHYSCIIQKWKTPFNFCRLLSGTATPGAAQGGNVCRTFYWTTSKWLPCPSVQMLSRFWGVCKLSSSKFPLGFAEDQIWTQKISNIWIHGHERSTAAQLGASLGWLLWQKITAAPLPNGSGLMWCEDNRLFTWLELESSSWCEKSVSELRVDTGVPLTHSKNKQGNNLFTKIIQF